MTDPELPQRSERLLADVVAELGGTARPQQQHMATRVAQTVAGDGVLLVQAGTGTGKSVGYLVPAVAAIRAGLAQRAVVATATLALQRQLVARDLPAVAAAAGGPVTFAVLKGRGNYLCRARLAGAADADPDQELDLDVAGGRLEKQAAAVRAWAARTDTGDRDDCPDDVDDRVWRSLSATGRECVGATRCDFGDDCFAESARDAAAGADVIVTNHALLALDALDETPVVPEPDVLIVDEAHEFAARATAAATGELSARSAERAVTLARPLLDQDTRDRLDEAVTQLAAGLAELSGQERPLPQVLVGPLAVLRDAVHLAVTAITADTDTEAATRHRALAALGEVHDVTGRLISGAAGDVTWFTDRPVPTMCVAPLSVAAALGDYLARPDSTVLTSATLTLGGDFTTLAQDLGIAAASWQGVDVGSPFAYERQGILYVAADLPRPGRDGPGREVIDRIRALVAAAGGRSMVLLSSWRAVDAVAANLIEKPVIPGVTVWVQRRGEPVGRLVERFAEDETSVLVGTMSLFQGVDVPGPACTLVIIDKIPFPRPDDPVLAARSERVEASGGNGFLAVSVPRAALLLAQGSGRLIRATQDRGVVAVLDPRLRTARYGGYLMRSMPPLWPTTDLAVTTAALQRLAAGDVTVGA